MKSSMLTNRALLMDSIPSVGKLMTKGRVIQMYHPTVYHRKTVCLAAHCIGSDFGTIIEHCRI